jgi:hypothetical protein
MLPAFSSAATVGALFAGMYEKAWHPAVVGSPSTSMLSLTAKNVPQSGPLQQDAVINAVRRARCI